MFKEKGIEKFLSSRENVYNLLKKRYEKINSELLKIDDPDITIDPNSGGFFLFLNLNPKKIKATDSRFILNRESVNLEF